MVLGGGAPRHRAPTNRLRWRPGNAGQPPPLTKIAAMTPTHHARLASANTVAAATNSAMTACCMGNDTRQRGNC